MFYFCYTRTENEATATEFFTRADVALYGATPENHSGGNSWDAMSGQRGLAQALRWTEHGEGVPKTIVVDNLHDLGKDVPGLVKQIAALLGNGISLHSMATGLWFSADKPEDTATEVIRALAQAHVRYVSDNRKRGLASARESGASIGRPIEARFQLDAVRETLKRLKNANNGILPSTRKVAKAIGCGPTKASKLLKEWSLENDD